MPESLMMASNNLDQEEFFEDRGRLYGSQSNRPWPEPSRPMVVRDPLLSDSYSYGTGSGAPTVPQIERDHHGTFGRNLSRDLYPPWVPGNSVSETSDVASFASVGASDVESFNEESSIGSYLSSRPEYRSRSSSMDSTDVVAATMPRGPRSVRDMERRSFSVNSEPAIAEVLDDSQDETTSDTIVSEDAPIHTRHTQQFNRVTGNNSEINLNIAGNMHPDDQFTTHPEPAGDSFTAARLTPRIARSSESHSDEPLSKVPRLEPPKVEKPEPQNHDEDDNDDDGQTCSICLDAWSNLGEHRLVSLKCGHLFGNQCIQRWLAGQKAKDKCCPTCKAKAATKDIRCIYAKKLVALDMSQLESIKNELQTVQAEKNKVELDLHKSLLHQKMHLKQITQLTNTVRELEQSFLGCPMHKKPIAPSDKLQKWRLAMEKNLEISKEGGCRVLAYNCRKYELYVSLPRNNPLFPGYGIRKVNCMDYRPGQFFNLHPKPIRDLSYSQPNDILLSASLDKTAKLISGQTGQTLNTIKCDIPLWSCCWDELQPMKLYVGGPGGVVQLYDIRKPDKFIERYNVPGDCSPIISLASVPSGFLSCHLNSCWIYKRTGSSFVPQMLPFDGPFLGLSYEPESEQILISCRPSSQHSRSRHIVCQFRESDDVTCHVLHRFQGSTKLTVMSRSCQVRIGTESWVAAHSESDGAVCLWSVNTGERLNQELVSQEPSIDMATFSHSGESFLATLTEYGTKIYKAVRSDF